MKIFDVCIYFNDIVVTQQKFACTNTHYFTFVHKVFCRAYMTLFSFDSDKFCNI